MPKGKRRAGTSGGHDQSRKKTRKVAKAKRPGPAPAAPKEVMPSAANARAAGLEKAKIAKKNDDMLGMAEGLLSITKNPHGRSYTLVENKLFLTATAELYKEAIIAEQKRYHAAQKFLEAGKEAKNADKLCGKKLKAAMKKAVPKDMSTLEVYRKCARRAACLLHMGHELADAVATEFFSSADLNMNDQKEWGWEATIIVNTSENRGKGSEEYIDDGRLLSSEVVKAIDSFVDKCHQNGKEGGGTVSARSIGLMLDEKFPDAPVTERAILYALTNFCNEGLGLKWGKVKNRKCQSDPGRLQVKQTYLRDFAAALKKEESGDYVLVYIDGNISTLSIVGC